MFYLFFGICFVTFAIRTGYHLAQYNKQPCAERRAVKIIVLIDMAVLWAAWFSMNFWDPNEITIVLWLRLIGLALFIIGVTLFILADVYLRHARDQQTFVTHGLYAYLRNPMYLGFILWIIGFPVFMQSVGTLVSAVIWIPHFIAWKIVEEQNMQEKYPAYREYKKKTWF